MRIFAITMIMLALVWLGGCAHNQASTDEPSWVHDTVTVTGVGTAPARYRGQPNYRLMARRGAIVDAARAFLEHAKGLQIDSQTYVRDFITESDEIRTRAQGWVKKGRIVSEQMNPDGSYEVKYEVPLWELWKYVKTVRREYR